MEIAGAGILFYF